MNGFPLRTPLRCIAALAFTLSLYAQEERFAVQSRLVLVPVTVTDSKGRLVDGLEASDFLLIDNGRQRRVDADAFGAGAAPIALAIAVQTSGVSAPALEKLNSIGPMIRPLIIGERGCAAVVTFDERVEWRQDWTNDPGEIALALNRLQPGEEQSGRMLDAAYEAIDRLRERWNARRVLLLISESRDRGSETELETVLAAAQMAGVTVYAATYSAFKTGLFAKRSRAPRLPEEPPPVGKPPKDPPPAGHTPVPPPLEQRVDILGGAGELARLGQKKTAAALARATGGATFGFTDRKGVEKAIQKLGAELHSQYVLSFVPEPGAAGFRHLEVRIQRSGKFRVRARPVYWQAP